LRASGSISKIANRINRQDDIDWGTWEAKRVEEALGFFLRKKLCVKADDLKAQYSIFLISFYKIESNIEKILDIMIDKTLGLKAFMCNHSIFDINANKRGDWLQRFMIKKLMPTDKEVYQQLHPDPVPQDLLDKFSIFDPVQIVLEMDLIKIQYGMWRRDHNKRVLDPINIIYLDGIIVKKEDVKGEIAKYDDVESDPVQMSNEDWLMEDDLPF